MVMFLQGADTSGPAVFRLKGLKSGKTIKKKRPGWISFIVPGLTPN
jgi:hypothetical protein